MDEPEILTRHHLLIRETENDFKIDWKIVKNMARRYKWEYNYKYNWVVINRDNGKKRILLIQERRKLLL